MAMNEIASDQSKLNIKVEGDVDDFQIIEETSDSEDESIGERQGKLSPNEVLNGNVVSEIVQATTGPSPVFGSVEVTNSNNVHFGEKHIKIYNGPVSIKQIVQSAGIVNESYTKTEDESFHEGRQQTSKKSASFKTFKIQLWHKLIVLVIGVVLIGGISSVVVVLLQNKNDQNKASNQNTQVFSDSISTDHTEVVGPCYASFQVIVILIILVPFTFLLMYCSLLTDNPVLLYNYWKNEAVSKKSDIKKDLGKKGICNDIDKADGLLISPNHLRIVSRTDWLAQPVELPLDNIRHPIPWVIITHTATESCHTQSACVLAVRLIQTFHIESKDWYDIGYNFLVGGDGSAYYGRGWDYVGAHTKGYNKYSIGIAFIGTFNKENPPTQQVEACKKLIKLGVEEGKLAKDYKLFAHRQLMSTLSPGDTVYDIIKEWPHFVTNYTSDLIPNY